MLNVVFLTAVRLNDMVGQMQVIAKNGIRMNIVGAEVRMLSNVFPHFTQTSNRNNTVIRNTSSNMTVPVDKTWNAELILG